MNGAESLVRTLLGAGVDVSFTNPGTSEMHFVAALDHVPGMRCVLCLFEGVATGAADGYYRIAGKPASTLLHLGPGLANGLANLHNAKKANSGVVNIVGEHALPHIALDAPLTSDIEGIAWPVSHWVKTSTSAAAVGNDAAEAVQAAMSGGQIATLILPGDTAWTEGGVIAAPLAPPTPPAPDAEAVRAAAEALHAGDALLLLGGEALSEPALEAAGRIAAKTGCGLLTEWANTKLARGAGRVAVKRIPYVVEQALETLAPYKRIILAGATPPVAFFAYPDKPGVLTGPDVAFTNLAADGGPAAALIALADELGAAAPPAHVAAPMTPERPTGPPTHDALAAVIARHIPEGGIIVDESVTTGRAFFPTTAGAPPHLWLNNRGGSIGYGLPVAVGAAIAAPGQKVIAMIGDGSAMYTPQALWSLAREGLDVTVVIWANRSYRILEGELRNVGVANPGPRAVDMLSLGNPDLRWTELARGMGVEAVRVETAEDFDTALEAGMRRVGPYLVEVML